MQDKKSETRFTIQFSRTDPAHLRVAGILNRLGRSFKAQYIADAVLFYESREDMRRPAFDEKYIGAVVNKILRDRENCGAGESPAAAPSVIVSAGQVVEPQPQAGADVAFDEAVEVLGEDGLGAIAGALELFRKKRV